MKKIIINLFFIMFTLLFASKSYAQCTSCDVTVSSGGNMLTLAENQTYCIDGDVSFSDISWANNTTICISSGSKLTINNNMQNNVNTNTVNFEIYGELQFGNPQFAVNVNMNIHPNGKYKSTGNTEFSGSEVNINNQSGTFEVAVLNLNSNSGIVKIINSNSATFTTNNNLNVGGNVSLNFDNEGTLTVGAQFALNSNSSYSNCGTINTQGFNIEGATIYNTGTMNILDKLEGSGNIFNYSILNVENILGSGKNFHNSGRIEVLGNSVADMTIYGPNDLPKYGEFKWGGAMGGLNNVIVYGNQLFTNSDGTSSLSEMFQNPSALKPQTGSNIEWAPCPSCVVDTTPYQCIDAETGQPVEEPVEECEEEIFFEDFGISDINNGNKGRVSSPYMPSGSYEFGNSHLNLPDPPAGNPWDNNPTRNAARIGAGFYAVVAPEFINDGWFNDDVYLTWWPDNVSDHTGNDVNSTNKGAVMVINAGEVLAPFYERTVNLDKNEFYKLSFWIYLVNGPTRVALDIIDPISGETLGTIETGEMLADDSTYEGKWTEHVLYLKTGDCTIDELIVSLRNDYAEIQGNDYFIDDISMVKWACEVDEDFFIEIECPSTPLATADINQIPQGHTATGNVLDNDEGNGLTVTGATYLDSNGNELPLPIGTPIPIYGSNGELAGTMTLNADGTYTFESDPDFSGQVPVTYEITDENGNTDTAVLSIEVIPAVNPSSNNPPIAQNDTASTVAGEPVTSNVLANDSDPDGDGLTVTGATSTDDNGNPITIPVGTSTTVYGTDENGNPVEAGSIVLNADGSYTFTPAPGFTGTVNPITYTISDGNGGSDTATLFIEVLPDDGKNHTFANDDANSALKGETMNGNVLDNDTDPEGNGQTVTNVTIDGVDYPITPGTPAEITIPGKGELTIDENGNYTFIPESNFVGTVVVGVTVCDDVAAPDTACDTSNLYLTSLDTLNCYKPAKLIANGGLNTEIGISSLRLDNTDGWPQVREGAWIALESKTKGFVPNRLSNAQIAAIPSANLVSGMMVYNTEEDCLQINVDGTTTGWKCFNEQGCLE